MDSIAQELNRVKAIAQKEYWPAISAYATVEILLADIINQEFSYVNIMHEDDMPEINICCHDSTNHTFMVDMKAWWESHANVLFEDKLTRSRWGGTLELVGYITQISTDPDSKKMVKVKLIGPPTVKCLRVLKREKKREVFYGDEKEVWEEVVVCPGNEVLDPSEYKVLGTVGDAIEIPVSQAM